MKEQGSHEDCIEQMDRLFRERYRNPQADATGRIRLDDWEMAAQVQQPVLANWQIVDTDNLKQLGDFDGYQAGFLRLFGFGLAGVDYHADTNTAVKVRSIP
jgi:enoyl-[acyl-carrier protein] reductase/trans-2-enoyl-CoA reductase (NAD+)